MMQRQSNLYIKHSETAGRSVLISAINLASVAVVAKFNTLEGAKIQLQATRLQSQAEKTDDFLTISKPNLAYLSVFFLHSNLDGSLTTHSSVV